ncbi:hypothetical protein BGZ81_001678 [Podila clonocystis]|nr:hypothetical protein BGZ81_001678 [Podila clonocystis]
MSTYTHHNHDPPRPSYHSPSSSISTKYLPPEVDRCTCLLAWKWNALSIDLTDALCEYETCIVSAACRQTKPKAPPANHRLQRLWFRAVDRVQYIQDLEHLIDEIERQLDELARQQKCRVQEIEDDERRHCQELEIMKSRNFYGSRK